MAKAFPVVASHGLPGGRCEPPAVELHGGAAGLWGVCTGVVQALHKD
ncbi:MAG: hypothetical protein KAY02_00665 [Acidovorax sp.]|nr:hypothetical protein [Acidovorax sp.]